MEWPVPLDKGHFLVVDVPNPGAGNAFTLPPSNGRIFEVIGASWNFVTDATVSNRHVYFEFWNGTYAVGRVQHPTAQAASVTGTYNLNALFRGDCYHIGGLYVFGLAKGIYIDYEVYLRFSAWNLQAGDTFVNIAFFLYEWIVDKR